MKLPKEIRMNVSKTLKRNSLKDEEMIEALERGSLRNDNGCARGIKENVPEKGEDGLEALKKSSLK